MHDYHSMTCEGNISHDVLENPKFYILINYANHLILQDTFFAQDKLSPLPSYSPPGLSGYS